MAKKQYIKQRNKHATEPEWHVRDLAENTRSVASCKWVKDNAFLSVLLMVVPYPK